jgi:hypothetical protein
MKLATWEILSPEPDLTGFTRPLEKIRFFEDVWSAYTVSLMFWRQVIRLAELP